MDTAAATTATMSKEIPRQHSFKTIDDVTSLTSFNPFSEEDEHDQSSYAIVTSLFSKVKNTLAAPLTSAVTSSSSVPPTNPPQIKDSTSPSNPTTRPHSERPNSLAIVPSNPAPPLVFLTPVVSEAPSFANEYDRPPSRSGLFYSPTDSNEGMYGTAIPGFPIADDARSIRTSGSTNLKRTASVSKVIRRIRGEGLSRDYWMDDENAKECYDCKSVFTTWRRKHHCRICGQIFCSRCASNIIKGSRFGQDGMIRVCNLCLEKLEKGGADHDDDDDRRSVVSSLTSHAMPQSPFAASQLFYRTDEPYSLFSIAETRRQISEDGSGSSRSRPLTPGLDWDLPAPFRRNLVDEERERGVLDLDTPTDMQSIEPQNFIQFPTSDGVGQSTIQFPGSSSTEFTFSVDTPRPTSMRTSRVNSFAETEIAVPFLRSRVQSRLEWTGGPEPGWRTRRESTAYAQELNAISMFHLRVILRQMLTEQGVPNIKEWEETLLKLALQVARDLNFTSTPTSMDVRQHVKIKKVPGGAPRDSEYVDGAVITKNVAHKQMARALRNPRVMLVTFPFEFHRVEGQYMHLDPLVNQEKQYLTNLVGRVAALRPHVVLVEKSVSRIALEALLEQNVAVARAVKPSAIQFVARMTQADVFSSMDKLAVEPRLGHCARYRLQTFDHILIPGQRKTFMRFEGCGRDMGCTIMLRGGDIATLRRIKNVTRFLAFVVRHLKMETHLWKDSVITLPPVTADAVPVLPTQPLSSPTRPRTFSAPTLSFLAGGSPAVPILFSPPQQRWTAPAIAEADAPPPSIADESAVDDEEDLPHDDAAQLRLSRHIQQSVEPYLKTFISISATLRFPPPYPIRRMKELDDLLQELKCAWEDEVILKEEKGSTLVQHGRDGTIRVSSMAGTPIPTPTPDLPKTPTPGDTGTIKLGETISNYFENQNESSDSGVETMRDSIASIVVPSLESNDAEDDITTVEKPIVLKQTADIAKESALGLAQFQHDEHRPVWEWYLRKNTDDFVIEHYQTLFVREYITPNADLDQCKPCFSPHLTYFTFYGENDCTLGQYIERSIADGLAPSSDPKAPCLGCDQPLPSHCKVYVHNESKLLVALEPWSGKIQAKTADAPVYDLITTWSVCRRCGQATPFIPVSEETLRYSFAKFLELHFYPADVLIVPGAGCLHNIYLDHTRYFAFKGMTVRFQADPVVLHEIVFPPRRIRIRPETLLELKNADYQRMLDRSATWFAALIHDLKLLLIELGDTDAESSIKAAAYIRDADGHRLQMARDIHRIYMESPPTDTLALGRARQLLQDHMVEWQTKLDSLPRPRLSQLTEKEPRRVSAFGSVRHTIWPSKRNESSATLDRLPSTNVSEAEEVYLRRLNTSSSLTQSSASENDSASEEQRRKSGPVSQSESENVSSARVKSPSQEATYSPSSPRSPILARLKKSDAESDSTIGARRMLSQGNNGVHLSKLPRRPGTRVSVAELVKRYQEGADAHISGLGSEQDVAPPRTRRTRSKKVPTKRPLLSDFEQSYAANIAPKYLTHASRRQTSNVPHVSRIPGPVPPNLPESRTQSRRTSPEKRHRVPGPPSKMPSGVPSDSGAKLTKTKAPPRLGIRDKASARSTSSTFNKSGFRRSASSSGNKVSNIARHFERISKDSERANRRYAVIRGRRARPVASARPSVQVYDSIQDVMRNESESSDSSSDADDEDDEDEDEQQAPLTNSRVGVETLPSTVVALRLSPTTEQEGTERQTPEQSGPERSDGIAVVRPRPTFITPISSSVGQSHFPSVPPSPGLPTLPVNSPALTPPEGWGPTVQERHSFMKAISGLWSQSQQLQPLLPKGLSDSYDDISADPVHIHRDSPIALRTDEPTSIIAVALSCKDYRERQKVARIARRKTKTVNETAELFMPDDRSTAESTSSWGLVDFDYIEDEGDAAQFLKQSCGSENAWSFDFPFDDVIITCVTMFPEQFHALRRICECEKSIIESLARCVKWNATGGKSGSTFLKTRDDRFIAKEMSKAELSAMATFAPAYFEYMATTLSAGRPTLLAKIFGCFRISFTKPGDAKLGIKGKNSGTVFMVMENLFYERRFTKIYDLKGSTRNRHVHATGRENEVLLDENLVQSAHLNPSYLREHSKRILRAALWNDTQFLADLNVMDYSLVVGVDSVKNELVMGIVDYIRTYTWDKKLESWVKDASFLGGRTAKGEPTIVTPKQYKARFRSAMERYFPLVPDRWMKQPDRPNEEGDSLLDLWPDN